VKSSRWIIPAVVVLGLLAGAAIVGRPAKTSDLRLPLDAGSTTSTTVVPTTTAAPATTAAGAPVTSSALLSTTTLPETTTTTIDPASVRVVVGNASARNGLATVTADELGEAGYVDVVATNAVSDSADSFIVYRDGFEAAALAVAELLDIPAEQVLPFTDTAVTERDDEGDVLVVVGADRAA
jgi:hypothetical protein